MIQLVHVADLTVLVGGAIEIGRTPAGIRRVIPITGGEVTGPRLEGVVLPGGADFQLLRDDGTAELHARYVIRTTGGAHVYIENSGLRHGPPEAMERLRRGEAVDPSLVYFRSAPRFETSDGALGWLTRNLFVAEGVRHPERVELRVYLVG
ncbi:MAG: DUF3237 domain-containing protein [Acidobacteriota bacterium]|nr:DUF3237 domain-containing protein [Acidobacteriota bacterium]